MSNEKPLLEVKNLKKMFSNRVQLTKKRITKAVDDVSFFINTGEVFGLVGESGCGKTTIGKLVVNLLKPDSGSISLEGEDITKIKEKHQGSIRGKVQMVFQDPNSALDPKFTMFEALYEAIKTHKLCASKLEAVAKIERISNLVGLNRSQFSKYPSEFSGGQRQRICIAKALIIKPQLIVCDEAVSALDVSIQAQILNTMIELKHKFNLTYLFISHNLAVVRYLSNRIGVMYSGKLVELGTANDIYLRNQHPYTKLLLRSVLEAKYETRFWRQETKDIDLGEILVGSERCRFCNRCELKTKACEESIPELREVAPGHFVACHLI